MGHPRLDPFNHTIRRIQQAQTLNDDDRRHVLAMIVSFKTRAQLSTDRAVIACAGLFSYAQMLRIQRDMEHAKADSAKYRALTWSYHKHLEGYKKALSTIGKANTPVVGGKTRPKGLRQSAPSLVADSAPMREGE